MGLFGSKKKTKVGTTVSRVIDNKSIPNSTKTGVIKAIIRDQNVAPTVLDELINGVGMRGERLYDYAKRGKYAYGLPSGRFKLNVMNGPEVVQFLSKLEGQPVTVIYSNFGKINLLHVAWVQLISQRRYNPVTNIIEGISGPGGRACYLTGLAVKTSRAYRNQLDESSLEFWGPSPAAGPIPGRLGIDPRYEQAFGSMIRQKPIIPPDPNYAGPPVIQVQYAYAVSPDRWWSPTAAEACFQMSFPSYDLDDDYLHVCYQVGNTRKYFTYLMGSGTYPELDELMERGTEYGGSYFPITYFRYGKARQDGNKSSQAYKSSKKLLKYINLDYQFLIDEIHKNPNIKDIEQAMMWFAVPAKSSHPMDARYLFEYFRQQYNNLGARESQRDIALAAVILTNQQVIWDTGMSRSWASIIQDKRFRFTLVHDGITKRRHGGNIAPVGGYTAVGYRIRNESYLIQTEDGSLDYVNNAQRYFTYRHQIAYGWYEEIQVFNPRMVYHIYGKYTDVGNEDEDILLIPLDHSITERFNLGDREELYARSLHFIFNSRVTIRVKWYQTGFFRFILMAVAVVISIWSGGQTLALVSALAASGMYGTLALVILDNIVTRIVIAQALRIFTKAVGVDIAIIVAVVAAVTAGYMGYSAGGLNNAPWADLLLTTSNGLVNSIGDYYVDALKGLRDEYRVFQEEAKELYDELITANELLRVDSVLSPLTIIGESPQDYFNRTIHNSNPGINTIKGVSTFVKRSLMLPTPAQTLGGYL